MALDQYIVQYGAPTLAGIKVGSLFSYPVAGDRRQVYHAIYGQNRMMTAQGVKAEVLGEAGQRILVYLYRPKALEALLAQPHTSSFLARFGYQPGGSVRDVLTLLRRRIEDRQGGFPHEIGIFLDYPLEDVEAFIAHGGKNYAFVDYWKAYQQPERARRICQQYRACTTRLMERFRRGAALGELVSHGYQAAG